MEGVREGGIEGGTEEEEFNEIVLCIQVAKGSGGGSSANQVAYLWAKSLGKYQCPPVYLTTAEHAMYTVY